MGKLEISLTLLHFFFLIQVGIVFILNYMVEDVSGGEPVILNPARF